MKTQNNPFPFYKLEGSIWTNYKPFWNKNRTHCKTSYSTQQVLFLGVHWFQLKLIDNFSLADLEGVDLRRESDNSIVSATMTSTLLVSGNNKYLSIKFDIGSELIGDSYYIGVRTLNQNYYSELFCVDNNKNNKVGVVWSADCKVGDLVYNEESYQRINLNAIVVSAEPEYEEEIEEDGFGTETPISQTLKQKYKLSCIVPNYLARALTAIQLHNKFNIIDFYNGEVQGTETFDNDLRDINVVSTPEEEGCNSLVEIVFTKETTIKTACCDEVEELGDLIEEFYTIYNENTGNPDEFDVVAVSDSFINTDASETPQDGSKLIIFNELGISTITSSITLILFSSVLKYTLNTSTLDFYIRFDEPVPNGFKALLSVYKDGEEHIELELNTTNLVNYGVNINNQNVWQSISIPFSNFGNPTEVNTFRIVSEFVNKMSIDNIQIHNPS